MANNKLTKKEAGIFSIELLDDFSMMEIFAGNTNNGCTNNGCTHNGCTYNGCTYTGCGTLVNPCGGFNAAC